ncbi:ATP-binding protein [Actinoplanes sp. GCM10030250]|uniref:ATP-binding protein n=1 Tax=Actinoplanes sp. GCM10030250 TaxID=3273376 RepID=UPI003622003B
MSSLLLLAPPAHTRQLLIWDVKGSDDLRQIRTGLHRLFDIDEWPAASPSAAPPKPTQDRTAQEEVAQRIALVATELVGNALRHGRPPVTVRLLRDPDSYIIDVSDHAPDDVPEHAAPREHISAGGRGLLIARTLAQQLCWYRDGNTKHVWASFPAPHDVVPLC